MGTRIGLGLLIISIPAWLVNLCLIFKEQVYKLYSKPLLGGIIGVFVFSIALTVMNSVKENMTNQKLANNIITGIVIALLVSFLILAMTFAMMHFKVAQTHVAIFFIWIFSLVVGFTLVVGNGL